MTDLSSVLFVAAARRLIGTRWRHRGRKPWAIDCVGLIVVAARQAGSEVADETLYGREPWDAQLQAGLRIRFGAPAEDAWRPGDVAVIRWAKAEPSHVGILADHPGGGLSLIHAHNLHGVVEQGIDARLRACVVEVYRPFPVGVT
jgi:cell wall-associated NlpC family hydrolase